MYSWQSRVVGVGIAAIAFILLIVHANHYMPFLVDDACISLRYAQRLIEGNGLTWNDGERVEGYSNLLWILANALLGWLGVDLIVSSRLLGLAGMGAALCAVVYAHHPLRLAESLPALIGTLSMVATATFAVWSIGGLEQPFVAAFLAWAMVLSYPLIEHEHVSSRTIALPGVCFGLLCLTRPDGALFTAAAFFALCILHWINQSHTTSKPLLQRAFLLLLIPVTCYLGQVGFRLIYYGEWVPNTALVKIAGSYKYLVQGVRYVFHGLREHFPLYLLASISILLAIKNKAIDRMLFLLLPLCMWLAYIALVGGDIFVVWRQFVPAIVLMSLMAAQGMEWVCRSQFQHMRRYWLQVSAAFSLVGLLAVLQFFNSNNIRLNEGMWEWDAQVVATMLSKAFAEEQPLLAVDSAGCLPYWSQLPALDMLGLNDYYIPRHPPPTFGEGTLGHELGDGSYVLQREPDLIIFNSPKGAMWGGFPSGRQMQKNPRFFQEYTFAIFQGSEPYIVHSGIWLRRNSPTIGIKYTDEQIVVPGYFLTASEMPTSVVVKLNQQEQPVVAFSHGVSVEITNLYIPPGRWVLSAKGQATESLRVIARRTGEQKVLNTGVLQTALVLPDASDGNFDFEFVYAQEHSHSNIVSIEHLTWTYAPDMR